MGGPKKPTSASLSQRSPRWQHESETLKEILRGCGLEERLKWGKPCYAHDGKNIVIIQKMKAFVALMFFKGSLLRDPEGALRKPGESSNIARRFEFTGMDEILASRALVEAYVREAVEIEKAGLKVPAPAKPVFAPELKAKLARDPSFKAAFEALTPGRQRGYNIYFSAPKGTEARARRIEKYTPKILAGKGFHDR